MNLSSLKQLVISSIRLYERGHFVIRRKIFAFRTCLERKGFSSRPLLQTGFQQPRIRIACIIDQSTKSSHATITRLTCEKRTINFYSSAPCARVKRFVMTRIYLENSQRYINQTIDNQLTRRNTTKIKTLMRFMKIIRYFEYGSYLRSYEDYLRSENNARKRNSGLYGMTSAITMQRSNN